MPNPYAKRGPVGPASRNPRANRAPAPRKFRNPLKEWRERRVAEQKALEDQAVQKVTNKIETNALTLIDELSSVDFIHSGLPEYVLQDRKDEEVLPQICSLEWDTRSLIQLIRDDRQSINMDIRPIDEKLMSLVLMFKQYVAHGDVMAARIAMDALKVGIHDVRCKLPVHEPELAEAFVEKFTEYLQRWITLVGFSRNYDRTGDNLDIAKAAAQDAKDRKAEQLDTVDYRVRNEPVFAEAFFNIQDSKSSADRSSWTDLEREVHTMLVKAKLEDFNINLHNRQTTSLENDMSILRHQMDSLRTFLNKKPDFSNPNLMNEYQDAMNQFVRDLAESDKRVEDAINMVDQLTGAMQQLDESQGHMLAMEAAKSSANKIMDEILQKQKDQTGMSEAEHARKMRERGLKTPEQIEAEKAAIQRQLAEEKAKETIKDRPRLRQ